MGSFKTWVLLLPMSRGRTRRNFWEAYYNTQRGQSGSSWTLSYFPFPLRNVKTCYCPPPVWRLCMAGKISSLDPHATHSSAWVKISMYFNFKNLRFCEGVLSTAVKLMNLALLDQQVSQVVFLRSLQSTIQNGKSKSSRKWMSFRDTTLITWKQN